MTQDRRDHGGGVDAAAALFGGARDDWLDLSTGINPVSYPVPQLAANAWTALPDHGAMERLLRAARAFWNVPEAADIVAAPGASALIARLPYLFDLKGHAHIPGPTYNEHAAAVQAAGRMTFTDNPDDAVMHVHVHPNNPDGRLWKGPEIGRPALTVIDESFCDVSPEMSHIGRTTEQGLIVLKSFGKFWGLAGLRLGFAIGAKSTLHPDGRAILSDHIGPWPVSGPALLIAAQALRDHDWARATRARLADDAARLDAMMTARDAQIVGGTTLFRLYRVVDAAAWQARLARHHIWTRIFPYDPHWLRLGLPGPDDWSRLDEALR